jgi:hypothetical protein
MSRRHSGYASSAFKNSRGQEKLLYAIIARRLIDEGYGVLLQFNRYNFTERENE